MSCDDGGHSSLSIRTIGNAPGYYDLVGLGLQYEFMTYFPMMRIRIAPLYLAAVNMLSVGSNGV